MNIARYFPGKFFIICCFLWMHGCASWQMPEDNDDELLHNRAVKASIDGVNLKAAVLSAADSRRIFGVNINETGVQPVWLEVVNNSIHSLWLLRSGTDPSYFSPLEVAWSAHAPFAGKSNAEMDEYFKHLSFEGNIEPGQTRSGIIFTNPNKDTKIFNVDLLGQQRLFPFTLFLPIPDDDAKHISRLKERYKNIQIVNYEDEAAFRSALENMPCCESNSKSSMPAAPVNMVLVGEMTDIAAALIRRGFRSDVTQSDTAMQLFGRSPDYVLRKAGQGGTPANWLRIWLAPISYQHQQVFLVQAGRPVGGRFVAADETLQLHPHVDEARNLIIQDMLYSGGLAQLGFTKGVGRIKRDSLQSSDSAYYTDGLRAVLFFVTRPLTLSDIEILDWEPLLKQRQAEVSGPQKNHPH